MGRLVFVLGGARSGKSRFAQEYAWAEAGEDVLYVATATVDGRGDDGASGAASGRPARCVGNAWSCPCGWVRPCARVLRCRR